MDLGHRGRCDVGSVGLLGDQRIADVVADQKDAALGHGRAGGQYFVRDRARGEHDGGNAVGGVGSGAARGVEGMNGPQADGTSAVHGAEEGPRSRWIKVKSKVLADLADGEGAVGVNWSPRSGFPPTPNATSP